MCDLIQKLFVFVVIDDHVFVSVKCEIILF